MKKIAGITVGIIFLIMIGIGIFFIRNKKQSPTTSVTVSLKWLHQAQFAGLYAAKEKGFYQDRGLDVRFLEYNAAKNQIDMLVNRETEFAVVNPTELFKAVDAGMDIKAVAVIYETSPYALISLKERDIVSPADFAGKILGNKGGTPEAPVLYNTLLKDFNVDSAKITFFSPGFDTTVVDDLMTKKVDIIDMFRTDQQYLFDKQRVDYAILKPELFGFESYGDVLITTGALIAQNPDLVSLFVQATIAGWQWALDNQAEAVDMTMGYVTSTQYQDKEYQAFIISQSEKLIRSAKSKPIGDMNYLIWRKMYDYLQKSGLLKQDMDVRSIYTTEFLP